MRKSPDGMCDVPRCRRSSCGVIYACLPKGKKVEPCTRHWTEHCDTDHEFDLRNVKY